MPNALSFLALLGWPLVTSALFRSLSLERAVIWSILGGYLLLPPLVAFDFPMIPPLDKFSIATLSAYIACVVLLGQRIPLLPTSPVGRALMGLFVVSPAVTVLTNQDPIFFPMTTVPGLRLHDSIAAVVGQTIAILPYFIARRVLVTEAAQREILTALVVAGLVYSAPMLMEVRLSPQLNTWVYGFFQHDFVQMMRYGGFRPIVFLPHGLWAAFFALMTLTAAVTLARHGPATGRTFYLGASGYLMMLLVLCKSAAVLVYAGVLVPVIWVLSIRQQIRIATVLAMIVVLFPLLRGADLVPVDWIVEQAASIDQERADSLRFRLDNEDALLARAAERPLFGWGSWGRNHVHDPFTGEITSTTDGRWIAAIGSLGWGGYIVEFGLLALPLLMLARASAARGAQVLSPYCGCLCLLLAFNMVDLLPNATLVPFTWLMAGSLLGYAEALATGTASVPAGPRPETAPRAPDRTIL
jgi:hypothetical protein